MERLVSIVNSAERLGVSPWTVRAWIHQGKLASVKLGSRRLVKESELLRLIEVSTVPALIPSPVTGFGGRGCK